MSLGLVASTIACLAKHWPPLGSFVVIEPHLFISNVYYLIHNFVVMLFKSSDHISFLKLVILASKNRNDFSFIIMLDSFVFLLKKFEHEGETER